MVRAALACALFISLVAVGSAAVSCRVGSSLSPSDYTNCTTSGYCMAMDRGATLGIVYSCAVGCTPGPVGDITIYCCQTDNCNALIVSNSSDASGENEGAVTCRAGSSLLPSAYTNCTTSGYCVAVDSGSSLGVAYSCAAACTPASMAGITTSCCQTDNCNDESADTTDMSLPMTALIALWSLLAFFYFIAVIVR